MSSCYSYDKVPIAAKAALFTDTELSFVDSVERGPSV